MDGGTNPLDAMTKRMTYEAPTMQRLRDLMQGRYEPIFGRRSKEETQEWCMQRYNEY